MKKTVAFILIIISLLSVLLTSCGEDKYPEVKSTDEESETVMTIEYDGEEYSVPYELYRAFFLTYKSEFDGGDDSVWTGEDKLEYVEKIDAEITKKISEIYGAFHVAKKIGIGINSDDFNERIKEYIRISVEGGVIDSAIVKGFEGDYDKYLASLNEMNLNYSVQSLLFRYSLAIDEIYLYYSGNLDSEEFSENANVGHIEYSKSDVKDFYDSSESVRVLAAYFPKDYFKLERVNEIRDTLASKNGEDEVAAAIIGYTTQAGSEVKAGELLGKHNLDRQYYGEYIDTAFSLSPFEVSPVIEVNTGYNDSYVILYKAAKTDSNFEENYSKAAYVYVQNEIGKILNSASENMLSGIKYTDYLQNLDRSLIKMD